MPRHAFRSNGGPQPFEVCFARWITKGRRPSNPVFRVGMPNIKSAKKRVKVNAIKAMNNQMAKSALKTTLKKFDTAVAAGDKAEATVAYTTAVKAVDQAAAKHLLHKNNAANKKSKMTTKLNGMA